MARQPKSTKAEKDREEVTSLSAEPVEPMPEEPGAMTDAAAVAHLEPVHREGRAAPAEAPVAEPLKWFRVTADRRIKGSTGFRAVVHAGKEFNNLMYDPKKLRAQGVKFEPIKAEDVAQF